MYIKHGVIFIDTSYLVFYKYFSALYWCKKKNININPSDVLNDNVFMNRYKKTFEDAIIDISNTYNIPMENIIFAKDCPRHEIWRTKLYPEYKGTRDDKKDQFDKGIFKYTYSIMIPWLQDKYDCKDMEVDCLEADDIIALSTDPILGKYPACKFVVITNDNDLIQLSVKGVEIYNLQKQNICNRVCDPENYLDMKVIMGDKSDNIPAIVDKCGDRTAVKLVNEPATLASVLQNADALRQFKLNRTLIDFNFIPDDLKLKFHTIFQQRIVT